MRHAAADQHTRWILEPRPLLRECTFLFQPDSHVLLAISLRDQI